MLSRYSARASDPYHSRCLLLWRPACQPLNYFQCPGYHGPGTVRCWPLGHCSFVLARSL